MRFFQTKTYIEKKILAEIDTRGAACGAHVWKETGIAYERIELAIERLLTKGSICMTTSPFVNDHRRFYRSSNATDRPAA